MKISLISPSRNTLKYLKWSYNSVRKNLSPDIEYCVADDFSDDGTSEWCREIAKNDPNFKFIRNSGPTRLGHTILYDQLITDVATGDIVVIWHSDMYATPGMDKRILEEIEPGKVISITRIEPPLHPPGKEKIIQDFGVEPEEFDEIGFLQFAKNMSAKRNNFKSDGIFAPWAIYREDFLKINGHDPLYAPQSREDSITSNRILILIENDQIKLKRIHELFTTFKHLSKKREDSAEVIDLYNNNIKIATATACENGEIGRGYIKTIVKKNKTKNIVRVRTSWGETECTEDHSLLDKKLDKKKPNELNKNNIWKPSKLKSWARRDFITEIDFNKVEFGLNESQMSRKSNAANFILPHIKDINEYGNNKQLHDICEFLGYFVAEGSTSINYKKPSYWFGFSTNDISDLDYFKEKSLSLFPEIDYGKMVESKKENNKPVYSYRKGSKILTHFLRSLVGKNSKNKKVPDFIFNLPKVYQKSFIFGYLKGDGYLGCNTTTKGSFCIDKRAIFNKRLVKHLSIKYTTSSDMLAAGIMFLMKRIFPSINLRLNYSKERSVYNISSTGKHSDILEIENIEYGGHVYDLEVHKNNTFIDALGFVGLHNSDIFNRFILTEYETIQLMDTFCYHMTCRGSRFNPKLTTPGTTSQEWIAQNNRSERNFIRKWGSMVRHTSELKPIIVPKYRISFVITNCNYDVLKSLEPYTYKIYIDLEQSEIERYIAEEQTNTMFDLNKKIVRFDVGKFSKNLLTSDENIVMFNATQLNNQNIQIFSKIHDIIKETGETGEFEFDIFKININSLTRYENDLIVVDKSGNMR